MHLITEPIGTRWSSWARIGGSFGLNSIPSISAGASAMITRFAAQVSLRPWTSTRLPWRLIRCTGCLRRTRLPSFFASFSAMRCDPPTIRSSWAPPAVLIRLSKLPAVAV